MNSKVVPYTTSTGLQIGCRYEQKQTVVIGKHMERLQTALLLEQTVRPGLWERLSRRLRHWLDQSL